MVNTLVQQKRPHHLRLGFAHYARPNEKEGKGKKRQKKIKKEYATIIGCFFFFRNGERGRETGVYYWYWPFSLKKKKCIRKKECKNSPFFKTLSLPFFVGTVQTTLSVIELLFSSVLESTYQPQIL